MFRNLIHRSRTAGFRLVSGKTTDQTCILTMLNGLQSATQPPNQIFTTNRLIKVDSKLTIQYELNVHVYQQSLTIKSSQCF